MKLQESEEVLHELRPERGILGIWFFTKVVPATLVTAILALFAFIIVLGAVNKQSEGWLWGAGIAGIVVVVGMLLLALLYCSGLRTTYVYYVTNQRCVFHGGILRTVERSVPYHKITDVEMSQNIVETALGIATLNIFTPGTGSMTGVGGQKAEISFVGLKDHETPAETINSILRQYRATGE